MKYIETYSTNPYYNLALEQYIFENRTDDDYLMLWQNDNTIVIGRNQNTYAEINADAVARYKVNVVRRGTGGGAVYHDLGNLNYSFITREADAEKIAFEKFVHPIIEALRKLGLNAETSGRNDIIINGCKVSGVAQRYYQGRVLHHGTLLYNENLDMANEVLHVDPDKIKAKGVKSVRSRIGNIRELLSIALIKNEIEASADMATKTAGDAAGKTEVPAIDPGAAGKGEDFVAAHDAAGKMEVPAIDSGAAGKEEALTTAPDVAGKLGNPAEGRKMIEQFGADLSLPAFWAYLKSELTAGGMQQEQLTPEELAQVEKIKTEKYDTWEWNYGRSLEADIVRKAHYPQGWIEARIQLDHGRIKDARIYGDFMTPKDLTQIEQSLIGREYHEEEIDKLLEDVVK